MSAQLSLFSAETQPPSIADLEGLLAGPGQVVHRGRLARVSVVVAEAWRVRALVSALGALALTAESAPGEQEGTTTVRTPFTADLATIAARWSHGSTKLPPQGFSLDGPRLRWWCIAAGAAGPHGYALALGPHDEQVWPAVGAALAAAGVPAAFLGSRTDRPAYRIVGQRRLMRLRELVGAAPPEVPPAAWPTARS